MSARPHGLDSATARMPQVARRAVASTPTAAELCWAVLVVDDEPAVHQVTRLALDGTIVLDRPLRLLHAHSGIEARAMLRANPEVALILLDVVMERDDAGLEFVRHVREDLGNQTVRIVLRTGQPGQAPEHHVMVEYDVNDYRHKTELTASQLFTSVVASIRAYRDIQTLRRTQRSLASVVGSSAALFGQHDLREFAVELLRELGQTAFFEAGAFFEHAAALGAVPWCGAALASHSVVNAAPFEMPTTLCSRLQGPPCTLVSEGRHHAVRFRQPKGAQATLALRASRELEDDERQVLALHLRNAAAAFDNVQVGREATLLARLPAELPEPIMRVSAAGKVLFANDASLSLLAHWGAVANDEVPAAWGLPLSDVVSLGRRLDAEIEIGSRTLALSLSPVPGQDYVNIVGRDVTDHRDVVSQLQHAAFYDELTGLHNRVHFRVALEAAIKAAAATGALIGLLLIDLDQFKQINDTLGHAAGDEALRIAGRRLLQMVRVGDVVARLGGDEFAVLVHQMEQPAELAVLADRLRCALSQPMQLGLRDWSTGASIGLTAYPRDASNANDLLRCADLAMFHAKRDVGDGVSAYDGEVHRTMRQRTTVEMLLRDALKHERLDVHFQPFVEMGSGRILGAEALVRMSQPDGTPVSPIEFIPVAEECGLIEQLGEWVLHRALTQARRWHDAGRPDLRIAVNVSSRQLRAPDVVRRMRGVFEATRIDVSTVEIELTESLLIGNVQDAMTRVWDLRGLGATLSIDDFGTGYSSLAYLRSLPVSKLKIDRSFVMDLPANRDASAIVGAVLSLAHSMRLDVVAEGVETREQVATLRSMGCEQGQGYLFSRPVSADRLGELLRLEALPVVDARAAGGSS